jgi:enamine deaminase RidA (YjgF/YER057c/UK114 family)
MPKPAIERFGKTREGFAQAVRVAGYPLVFTRQIFPVDATGKTLGEGEKQAVCKTQAEQLAANLARLLETAQSDWQNLVRLHLYVTQDPAAETLLQVLRERIPEESRPTLTIVQSPLPVAEAEMALDAVAVSKEDAAKVMLLRVEGIGGEEGFADAAILPGQGGVFFSGYPEKGDPAEAVRKSAAGLLEMAQGLGITRAEIVQLKVFAQPVGLAQTVKDHLREVFADQLVPPVVFVEWIASAPVEIEMIAAPGKSAMEGEKLRFYNPPKVKPSPTFSRVALLGTSEQIYISGLIAREATGGSQEVRDIFVQLEEILKQVGSDMRHLVKATYYVSGQESSSALDKIRPEYFDPARPPAASKATVHGVAMPDRTITVDMICVRP